MIGPSNYKPKGTWTRINRMNFGLGGFTKAIMLPGLGKRDSREVHGVQIEEQNFKKGKLSNNEESNEDRKSTRLNSSHQHRSRMPSSA